MTHLEKVIEEGIEEVLEHASIRAADSALFLQAARMGGGGYDGEPLQAALRRFADKVAAAVKVTECPHFITPEGQARCKTCSNP